MTFSMKPQYVLAVVCLATLTAAKSQADDATKSQQSEVAQLVAVLASGDSSVFDKAKACQRLAVVGDESAVTALAALLDDEKLSNYARYSLEGMANPAADKALRDALGRLEGRLLIGVVNSVGERRDAKAVDALKDLLENPNVHVANAAARSLGEIGTTESAEILGKALQGALAERREALAQALIASAQRLTQKDQRSPALSVLAFVRGAEVPQHIKLAATHSSILARDKVDGTAAIVELLNSEDDATFRQALKTARMVDYDVTSQLADQFDKLPAERQALLVLALGDLNAEAALPTLKKAIASESTEVRVQAMRVLAEVDNASPDLAMLLLQAALEKDERVSQQARSTLAQLKGEKVDAPIVSFLHSREAAQRQLAIELAAERRIESAAPTLLELAGDPDAKVRLAAVKALGSTVPLKDLPKLLDKTKAGYTADEIAAAREAARVACGRLPRDRCAEVLANRVENSEASDKAFLMALLGVVGGEKALDAVVAAANSNDNASQDAATRVLGEWLTADAAPAMFGLAKSLKNPNYKIRVQRGYIRIARQLDMPIEDRIEVCRNALAIAVRNDERALVLDALRRYPAPEGLSVAVSLLDTPGLQEDACSTIVAVANRVVRVDPAEAERALQLVVRTSNRKGVTDRAKQLIAQAQAARESQ